MYTWVLLLIVLVPSQQLLIFHNAPLILCSDKLHCTTINEDHAYAECPGISNAKLSFVTWSNLTERNTTVCDDASTSLDTTEFKLGNITCDTLHNCISDDLNKNFLLPLLNEYVFTIENNLRITAYARQYCMAIVCFWSIGYNNPNCRILNLEFSESGESLVVEKKSVSRIRFEKKMNTSTTEVNCGIIIEQLFEPITSVHPTRISKTATKRQANRKKSEMDIQTSPADRSKELTQTKDSGEWWKGLVVGILIATTLYTLILFRSKIIQFLMEHCNCFQNQLHPTQEPGSERLT